MPKRNVLKPSPVLRRKPVIAWALYDCGNSAFATSVMTAFFPLLFNQQWSSGASGAQTTTRLMLANGIASLLLAIAAPLLGAVADRGAYHKLLLGLFAFGGAAATAGLYAVGADAWLAAAATYTLAAFCFAAANVFYDSMLSDLTQPRYFDRVSAFGFAAGYLGGGLLLLVHIVMLVRPSWFAFADVEQATRVIFLTVGLWWAAFTLPLLLVVPQRQATGRRKLSIALREGLAQLRGTFRRVRELRSVLLFLIAYWLYIDGVNTLVKAAVDFGYKLGIEQFHLIIAVLVVQLIAAPAAMGFGYLGEWIGPKRGILLGLSVYIVVTGWAPFMDHVWEFYMLACGIGMVQGSVFSLSRSLYARLIPPAESAEFFGFYNLIGKLAAVLGPFLVAAAASVTGTSRAAPLAILPLLVAGGALLWRVPEKR